MKISELKQLKESEDKVEFKAASKIDLVMEETGVSRKTAAKCLDELDKLGIVSKQRIWKDNYYINTGLFNHLQNVSKL